MPEVDRGLLRPGRAARRSHPKSDRGEEHVYRLGRVPRTLMPIGERLEPRFGRLGREYQQVVFDKDLLTADPRSNGSRLAIRCSRPCARTSCDRARNDLRARRGLLRPAPARTRPLDVFAARSRTAAGKLPAPRLFVVESECGRRDRAIRQPTIFLDLAVAPPGTRRARRPALPGPRQSPRRVLYREGAAAVS